jgi:hypothetical protein
VIGDKRKAVYAPLNGSPQPAVALSARSGLRYAEKETSGRIPGVRDGHLEMDVHSALIELTP